MNNLTTLNINNIIVIFIIFFVSCNKNILLKKNNNLNSKQIYLKSIQYTINKSYNRAIRNLLLLNIIYPYNKFAKKSKLAIIFCYYKSYKLDLAIFNIKNLFLKYPNCKKIDYIYYLKGLVYYDKYVNWYLKYLPFEYINKDISYARKSFLSFQHILNLYPESKYVLNSLQRLLFLKSKMIKYEISIAKFYLKKKAYLSAANRLNFILKNFYKNEHLNKALKMLLYSYNNSKLFYLSKEIKIMLRIN